MDQKKVLFSNKKRKRKNKGNTMVCGTKNHGPEILTLLLRDAKRKIANIPVKKLYLLYKKKKRIKAVMIANKLGKYFVCNIGSINRKKKDKTRGDPIS